MLTANERLILERSAKSWSLRAELLERVEDSARERLLASAPLDATKDGCGRKPKAVEGFMA
jgi:hypothetical protein